MLAEQRKLIQTVETLSFNALPALEQQDYDGWILRYANGYTRRANSVNPVYGSTEDVALKIDECETFYTSKNRPTVFKMTDAVYPQNLDTILENRGYRKEAETYVYTMSLIGRGMGADNVRIDTQLSETWVNHFASLNQIPDQHKHTLEQMLALIPAQCGFLNLLINDEVVGVALGVVDGDWMGIFDVVVHSEHRGKGYGRIIIEALFDWGVTHNASKGYLQVQADNTIATALYQSLGFAHQYAYWYRVKDLYQLP
jgi:N-acetylglutamate synthase